MKSRPISPRAIFSRLQNLVTQRDWLTERVPAQKPRSTFIRHVDAGSDNSVELEVSALSNPIYDFERFGFHIVASPRHADVLLISGPITRGMRKALLDAFQAMPKPRHVVTVGDGFQPDGVFKGSYATSSIPEEMVPNWIAHIMGDPPSPENLLTVLLQLEI